MIGWVTSGAVFKMLSVQSDKGKDGSTDFRQEVASYAQKHSIQDASVYSGLSETEVKQCIVDSSKVFQGPKVFFQRLSQWRKDDHEEVQQVSYIATKTNP